MADRRRKHRQQQARRDAQIEQVASSSGQAREQRQRQARDEAARSAAAGPSAARWLVPSDDGTAAPVGEPVDVVADLLALDPRTRLRGRGEDELRRLAGQVEGLVTMGVTTPAGRTVAEVVVPDPDDRAALEPELDLDALLADAPVSDNRHDRVVRIAEQLLVRAAEHRDGEVDLHGLVAPPGVARHVGADELEVLVEVGTDGVALPAGPEPAVVVMEEGWVGASPVELFVAAARGVLEGRAADVGGAALYAWMQQARQDPTDAWWAALTRIQPVDLTALLDGAAARAGSDHPSVAGGILVEMIAMQHPLL